MQFQTNSNPNCQFPSQRRKAATEPMTTGVKQNCAFTWTAQLQRFHKHKFPTLRSYLPENNNRFKPDSKLFFPTPYTQVGIIWTIWSPFRNDKFFDGVWGKKRLWGIGDEDPKAQETFGCSVSHTATTHLLLSYEKSRERGWDRKEAKRGGKQELKATWLSSSKPSSNFLTYCKCPLAPSKTSFFLTHK